MEKENRFVLSVIVPCFNVGKFVEQCVDSICHSVPEQTQLICINDGSTDDTLSRLEKLRSKFCQKLQFQIVNQTNKGLSESRNVGIDLARGKYVCFIDSDDWVHPHYFKSLLALMDEDVDLAVVSYFKAYENNLEIRRLNMSGKMSSNDLKRRLIGLVEKELADPSQADSVVTLWGKMYRSEIIKDNNLKLKDITVIGSAEDLLFNLDYLSFCNQSVFVKDEPLYYYRKSNASSFTKKYRPQLHQQWEQLFQFILQHVRTDQEHRAYRNRQALALIGLGLNELANPKGKRDSFRNLSQIVSQKNYQEALNLLKMDYFPLHWKFFFWAARKQKIGILYILLQGINFLNNRKIHAR